MESKSRLSGIKQRARKGLPRLLVILIFTPAIYFTGYLTDLDWAKALAALSPLVGGVAVGFWLMTVIGGEEKKRT